jgi:hypothetical protein
MGGAVCALGGDVGGGASDGDVEIVVTAVLLKFFAEVV